MDGGSAAIFDDRGESFAKRFTDPVVMIRGGGWFLKRAG